MGRLRHREAEGWSQGAAETGSKGAFSSRKLSLLSLLFFLSCENSASPSKPVSHPPAWPTLDEQVFMVQLPCPREVPGSRDEMKIRPKELAFPKAAFTGSHPALLRPSLLQSLQTRSSDPDHFYLELDQAYEITFPRLHQGLRYPLRTRGSHLDPSSEFLGAGQF